MIDISVIIPTYNPGPLFKACLESVFGQDVAKDRYEVLVVLNGDVESYRAKVNSLVADLCGGARYSVLESTPAGVSRARNMAIKVAVGRYLAFVDDDDLLSPNYLSALLARAAEDSVVASNVYGFRESVDEKIKDYLTYTGLAGDMLKDRKYWNNVCCKLIPKSAMEKVRFDEKLWQGEDALVMFSLSRYLKRLEVEPEAYYYRRLTQGSASRGSKRPLTQIVACKCRQMYGYLLAYAASPGSFDFRLFASRFIAVIKRKL